MFILFTDVYKFIRNIDKILPSYQSLRVKCMDINFSWGTPRRMCGECLGRNVCCHLQGAKLSHPMLSCCFVVALVGKCVKCHTKVITTFNHINTFTGRTN